MAETQRTITDWATHTFGEPPSDARVAARANEEMAELLRAVTSGQTPDKVIDEAADVVIVLYRLCDRLGGDLMAAIDAKMAVNRGRQWRTDGNGHGYHVREKAST